MPKISGGYKKNKSSFEETMNQNIDQVLNPIVPEEWQNAYDAGMENLGPGGITAVQQPGIDALTGLVSGNPAQNDITAAQGNIADAQGGIDTARGNIGDLQNNYFKAYADRGSNTLGAFFPDAPQISAAQVGEVGDVSAKTAKDYMDQYGSYEDDLINATSADMEEALNRRLNIGKMAAAAGGAYGGGRQGVSEGQAVDDFVRSLGTTTGNLRMRGFETRAGIGADDANRDLTAGGMNQRTQLQRALTQAGLDQQANQAQAALTDSRQRFDIGQADIGDDRRIGVIQDMVNNEVTGANLGTTGANLGVTAANLGLTGSQLTSQDAMNLINSGAIGPDQLATLLAIGTGTFGEDLTRRAVTDRSGSGRGSGINFGGSVDLGAIG